VNRFRIDDSFEIKSVGFVFVGEVVEGKATSGMVFYIPEAGHRWRLVIKSVEIIRTTEGTGRVGLVVENPEPGYLPGAGVGWTTDSHEPVS
jgi:selenocysteine-specific translation elongation factor